MPLSKVAKERRRETRRQSGQHGQFQKLAVRREQTLTRRDYLAAHAPPVPSWFSPAGVDDASPIEILFSESLAQWPWHYADLVLSKRSAKKIAAAKAEAEMEAEAAARAASFSFPENATLWEKVESFEYLTVTDIGSCGAGHNSLAVIDGRDGLGVCIEDETQLRALVENGADWYLESEFNGGTLKYEPGKLATPLPTQSVSSQEFNQTDNLRSYLSDLLRKVNKLPQNQKELTGNQSDKLENVLAIFAQAAIQLNDCLR